MYKLLQNNPVTGKAESVQNLANWAIIPFDPANTDYQNFKLSINNETDQLETYEEVVMSPSEAKAYVATLP